jgi:hypothetical protein
MTYRGRASGRRYPFDLDDCCAYVLDEDLELFRAHTDFEVFDGDDSHIDPALERARVEREQLTEQVAQRLMSRLLPHLPPVRRTSNGPRGRKPGTGFGLFLDCLMNCSDLRGQYGSVKAAYDAIAERVEHMPEWSGHVPPREHFPNARSYGRAERLKHGGCAWRGHPEPWPA